jgi:hypothetical protein
LHEKWFLQLIDSSLRSLRISVISALNIFATTVTQRSQRYAEIAERTSNPDRDYFSCKATLATCPAN